MRHTNRSFNIEEIFRDLANRTGADAEALLDEMKHKDHSLPTLESLHTTLRHGGCAWASWAANSLVDPDDFEERFGNIVRGMDFVPLKLKDSTT